MSRYSALFAILRYALDQTFVLEGVVLYSLRRNGSDACIPGNEDLGIVNNDLLPTWMRQLDGVASRFPPSL
jgi:hypothetical protein